MLVTVCRTVLAVTFLMAALTKIADPEPFNERIADSGLSESVGFGVAAWLPWLELTLGMALLLGFAVREAALLLSLLLVLLLGYSLLHLGEPDCGCFAFPTVLTDEAWWWPPVRNVLLLVCGVRVASFRREPGASADLALAPGPRRNEGCAGGPFRCPLP